MVFHAILSRLIRRGALTVRYPGGAVRRYGGAEPGPEAAMEIRTPRALRRMVLDPGLAFGEGYMDGEVAPVGCGIHELLDVLVLNLEADGGAHPAGRAMEWVRRAKRRLDQLNPAPRARRNAAHHYDLDRRLFSLFRIHPPRAAGAERRWRAGRYLLWSAMSSLRLSMPRMVKPSVARSSVS